MFMAIIFISFGINQNVSRHYESVINQQLDGRPLGLKIPTETLLQESICARRLVVRRRRPKYIFNMGIKAKTNGCRPYESCTSLHAGQVHLRAASKRQFRPFFLY